MKQKSGIYIQIRRIAAFSIFVFVLILFILYFFKRKQEKIILAAAREQFNHEVQSLLNLSNTQLKNVVYDYTFWDELVEKVGSKDSLWFQENITSILNSFHVDFVVIFDKRQKLVHRASINPNAQLNFFSDSMLTDLHKKRLNDFYIISAEGLLEVSAGTIHGISDPTHKKTMPEGYFFLGKYWDTEQLKKFEFQSSAKIQLSHKSNLGKIESSSILVGERVLLGWKGQPIAKIRFAKEDHAYELYHEISRTMFVIIVLSIILFGLIFHFFSIKLISKPLSIVTKIFENNDNELIETLKKAPGEYSAIAVLFDEHFKQKEELLISRNKAEESERLKSAFLANMSHEIRTPMNGILGFTELLRISPYSEETQDKYLNIIEKSGRRLLAIINDLIDLSKIESGLMKINRSITNVNSCVDYVYSFFKLECDKKGLKLNLTKSLLDNYSNVFTDKEKLYASLINLVKNAIKFTNVGEIDFGYTIRQADKTNLQSKASFLFFVKDTGIGIVEEKLDKVFDRFVQIENHTSANYEGSGLGLSITKAYINMLGGDIWLESEPEIGTQFFFTIPYSDDNYTEIIHIDKETNIKSHKKKLKILIAEDDETSNDLLQKILIGIDSEIVITTNSKEAIDYFKNHKNIDLILLDIRMPGIDGLAITKEIRKTDKNIIIIAQTAFAFENDREKAILAGCNDYIAKPIVRDDLIEIIGKYFELG